MESLPLDLVLRACSFLPSNDIACTARLINKAAHQRFYASSHRTVRLSQPVPHHAFAARYRRGASPDHLKQLSLERKRRLMAIIAATGTLDNVATLVERMEPPFWWVSAPNGFVDAASLDACVTAARNRHMHVVRFLVTRGYPFDVDVTMAAVMRHCDLADALWLLAQEPVRSLPAYQPAVHLPADVIQAAGASTPPDAPAKVEWMLTRCQSHEPGAARRLAMGAAQADNLPAVQALVQKAGASSIVRDLLLEAAAAGSLVATSWLLLMAGSPILTLPAAASAAGACRPRLLRLLVPLALGEGQAGKQVPSQCWRDDRRLKLLASAAGSSREGLAAAEQLASLQLLWGGVADQGEETRRRLAEGSLQAAAEAGSLEAVRWLWRLWPQIASEHRVGALCRAAARGDLALASFLHDEAGAGWAGPIAMLAAVLRCAWRGADTLGLLRWLHERGCPLGRVPVQPEPGVVNLNSLLVNGEVLLRDLPVLQWLYDAGVVGRDALCMAEVFERVVGGGCVAVVEWLAATGCCPMGHMGTSYLVAARNADLDMLRCLKRLGARLDQGTNIASGDGGRGGNSGACRKVDAGGGRGVARQADA